MATSDDCDWHAKGIFTFFEFTDNTKPADSNKDTKLTGGCKLCKPARTIISGRKSATSNFRKHVTLISVKYLAFELNYLGSLGTVSASARVLRVNVSPILYLSVAI